MRIQIGIFAFAAAWVLAAPAAHAFSMQDKDASDPYNLPKFDIEEQSRNFRAGGAGTAADNKKLFETPLGSGTLQFGVQQGSAGDVFAPGFGMFGPGFGPPPRNTREDFNRVVTPENLR